MMKVPDGTLRILVQGTQRVRLGPYVAEEPYLVARITELPDTIERRARSCEALTRNVQRTFSEIVEQIPYLPEELQMAVANIDDPAALGHLIAGALRISTEEKQELLEEVDVAPACATSPRSSTRELEVVQLGTQIQSQVAVRSRQRPARVLPPPAAESDPGRARRGRRAAGRGERAAPADRGGGAARARPQSRRPRALAAGETAAGRRRARRHPHLPRVAGRAALVEGDRGQPRHRPRPRGPRRRPLRPREDQGPDPRVPGGAQTQPRLARPDPLLRRPARRRQDQPRPLDRPRAGPRVRADLGRRRARRGRDPRPPPHLHRRPAGDDRPRPARRRHRATRSS